MATEVSVLLTDPILAVLNCHVAFVRLDRSASLLPLSQEVPRPSLCLQLPGRIFRVVQKSTVLTTPCSMNTAAVVMVTVNGTNMPEKVEYREAAIGTTSTV